MIKKLVTLTLVVAVVLSSSLMAFAEETETRGERAIRTESREKPTKAERTHKLLSFFQEYNPGEYNAIVSALNEHETFHLNAKAYFETLKADFQSEKEAIKASYESGEMTEEEFQAYVAAKREEHALNKGKREIIVAEKQAAAEVIKEQRTAVNQALREALKSEIIDSDVVQSLLSQMLVLLNQHIDMDNYYFNLLTENNPI